MTDIVIVSAARTPSARSPALLLQCRPMNSARVAISSPRCSAPKSRRGRCPKWCWARCCTAGQGMNPARQASRAAGVPDEAPAWSLNQVCGSGLRAVVVGYQQIKAGDAKIVVAGGQENMSLSLHAAHLRNGQKMGALEFKDTMINDGLTDVFNAYHMGITAENVAEKWQITRAQQDEFATASQKKASAAQKAGKFKDEICAVTVKGRKGDTVVENDEYIKHDATLEGAAALRAAFKKDGTVTAANASGINDGAAALVLMSAEEAKKRGTDAAGAHRLLGLARRRSGDDGLGADPGVESGA